MMKKNFFVAALLLLGTATYAQVGINTTNPRATLDVVAKIPSGASNANIKDGIIVPNVDRGRAKAMGDNTTPRVTESTLIYINNVSTGSATGSAINVTAPGYYYFDSQASPSPGLWQALRPANVDLNGFQLVIPPHNQFTADFSNHSNSNFDSDGWWIISKSSVNSASNRPARMTIVYEYQGVVFNINKLYPQLTAGNNASFPDAYTANMINIANNGTGGKTRLTVSIVRTDNLVSNWEGTFYLNALLARKIN
ncbi:hypothetical protein [Chryseobacterium piperi]|uniref:hypothetical protein n=1 Tax=Chryseobacterium piperi TaxID=558152 RepID=UPI000B12B5E5|nr:hypothetical protein [Chryseobacterium piperi]